MESQIEKQLEKIMPEDLARTFESAYHVLIQGDHEHMDDLLKNGSVLLKKVGQRLSPTQMILGIAAVAVVAIVVVNRSIESSDDDSHKEDEGTSAEPVKDGQGK